MAWGVTRGWSSWGRGPSEFPWAPPISRALLVHMLMSVVSVLCDLVLCDLGRTR